MEDKVYICIDLKAFYASVECVERNLDPLTTNLVVADNSRTEKTICLAISPSLKKVGVGGRARLFEVIQHVKEYNKLRLKQTKNNCFIRKSFNDVELETNPELELDFIIATPQMAHYIDISSKIYSIYLKYVSSEDIHVYSIDEVFIDATKYIKNSKMTPYEFALCMIKDVLKETGITATVGIATNMYLAKVAMDIIAKKMKANEDGVRIAYLDEIKYRQELWHHKPLTDFWRVGIGYAKRLEKLGLYTMGDIAKCSIGNNNDYYNEDLLYGEFGINAELLIDHAWGYEPTTINDIKSYKPKSSSLSSGQVFSCAYTFKKAKVAVKEMIDLLALDLVEKQLLTNQISLYIGYDTKNLKEEEVDSKYEGAIEVDYLGRKTPKASHGSINLNEYTSSTSMLIKKIEILFDNIANPLLLVRRINISANNLIKKETYQLNQIPFQLNLFEDYDNIEKEKIIKKIKNEKEEKLQHTIINIKNKYGKNAILKGMNLSEGATTKQRNKQIGGHKA